MVFPDRDWARPYRQKRKGYHGQWGAKPSASFQEVFIVFLIGCKIDGS